MPKGTSVKTIDSLTEIVVATASRVERDTKVPHLIREQTTQRLMRLLKEVEIENITNQADLESHIASILKGNSIENESGVILPVRRVQETLRDQCKKLLGHIVHFTPGAKNNYLKGRNAAVVYVNSKNVFSDTNCYDVSARHFYYRPHIDRRSHREFLESIANNTIQVVRGPYTKGEALQEDIDRVISKIHGNLLKMDDDIKATGKLLEVLEKLIEKAEKRKRKKK
jgi:hypothetical protein